MKKTRRRYDRDFKISIVAELEGCKPPAQIAREYEIPQVSNRAYLSAVRPPISLPSPMLFSCILQRSHT
ncbi:MAG TPA: transposase [Methanotrichaceae archaeon]|nr:transposase [Methanotrichaceae archaeon]